MRTVATCIPLIVIFLVTSCGGSIEQKQKKTLETLAKEVMEIHDRTMADHGKLFKFEKKLLSIYESQSDSMAKSEINKTLIALEKADKDMMDWMHKYHEPEDFLPFEEKKAYYTEQRDLIKSIEDFTNQTIDDAKLIIEKYPIEE